MKTIFTLIGILFFSISAISGDFETGNKKHKEPAKPQAAVRVDSKTAKAGDVADYAISINGPQNTVKIGSADAVTQTPANPAVEATAKNTIEINGEGNSVTVNPETTGKVAVKQTGNNNRVNISQTNGIHSNRERR